MTSAAGRQASVLTPGPASGFYTPPAPHVAPVVMPPSRYGSYPQFASAAHPSAPSVRPPVYTAFRSASAVGGAHPTGPPILSQTERIAVQPRRATDGQPSLHLPLSNSLPSSASSRYSTLQPSWTAPPSLRLNLPPQVYSAGIKEEEETTFVEDERSQGPCCGRDAGRNERKETPNFLKVFCLLGGLLTAGCCCVAAADFFHVVIDPVSYILTLFQACLGAVVFVYEASWFARLSPCQKALSDRCAFLNCPICKGLFYMYIGIVSLSLRTVASFYTIPGTYMVVVGFFCVMVQKTVLEPVEKLGRSIGRPAWAA
ncbi:hypothetical protein BESB_000470 [Besnoitia besnoiti]|uniref:Transmembrane protein n=1 Tax=Besnoitia besnoiti TaxID=94643 RepID=A0A2A9MI92_BESBE|nr:hypothetical protein BESB_000470 [Besnoitia besnoiti]PFH37705.1 hypothetical protein BESB_000470 [Besnoitia besnoiti]